MFRLREVWERVHKRCSKFKKGEPNVPEELEKLDALSGHADKREFLQWIKPIAAGLRKIFLVHGEPDQQAALKEAIGERFGIAVETPGRGQTFEL